MSIMWLRANPPQEEEAVSTETNQEGLAPASGADAEDGVREIHPVVMYGKGSDYDLFDFRGRPEEAIDETVDEVDPKASPAVGSALAAIYEQVKTPLVRRPLSEETPASVEKEPDPDKTSENGSSTGSETQSKKSGSDTPPA